MNKIIPPGLLFILVPMICVTAHAQTKVEIDARPTSILVDLGETLHIEVVARITNGELPRSRPVIVPPDPANITIGSPSGGMPRVQQTSNINGVVSSYYEVPFIFPVTFKAPGKYRFSDIYLDYTGNRYRLQESRGFEITVTSASILHQDPVASEPVQVFARLDRQQAYRGEMVILSVIAYSHYPLPEPPVFAITGTFDGFFSERVTGDTPVTRETINGIEFYVRPAQHRFALFPIGQGMLRIPSFDVRVTVETQEQTRDFFSGRIVNRRVLQYADRKTRPVYLEVKNLPDTERPAGFSGLVGDLSLDAQLSQSEAKQGEGLSLTIRVQGQADFSRRWEPELPDLSAFAVHEPETSKRIQFTDEKLLGDKAFVYPLVPRATGEVLIGPVRLPIFNPRLEQYQVLETKPLVLQVIPSDRPRVIHINTGHNIVVEVNPLDVDFRYIHDNPDLLGKNPGNLAQNPLFLSAHAIPLLFLGGAAWYRRHRIRLRTDEVYARSTAAPKRTRKALAEAVRLENPQQAAAFHAALSRAILELLEGRFHVPAKGLTQEALRETLVRKGLPQEPVGEIIEFLNLLDEVRFAGTSIQAERMRQERERAQALVSRLMKIHP